MKRQHLNYFQRGGVHGCTEGKIPEVEVKKGSPSVHSNHAVFVVVAHFHGAVSPRLVPIKQPGGGLLKIPSNYAVVFGGRQDRQVAVRQQVWAPLPLPDCPTGSIQHTTWDHTPLPSVVEGLFTIAIHTIMSPKVKRPSTRKIVPVFANLTHKSNAMKVKSFPTLLLCHPFLSRFKI